MKLYATITSDRGGRPAKKGGNEGLTVNIDRKKESYEIRVREKTFEIIKKTKEKTWFIFEEKGKTDKR